MLTYRVERHIPGFSVSTPRSDGLVYPSYWHQPYDPKKLPEGIALVPLSRFASKKKALGLYARVDADVAERVHEHNWSLQYRVQRGPDGFHIWSWTAFARISVPDELVGGTVTRSIPLHRFVLGLHAQPRTESELRVVNLDGDGLNCLRSNLRVEETGKKGPERIRREKITGRRGIFLDETKLRLPLADEHWLGQHPEGSTEWVIWGAKRTWVANDNEAIEAYWNIPNYRKDGWLRGDVELARFEHIEDAVRFYHEEMPFAYTPRGWEQGES